MTKPRVTLKSIAADLGITHTSVAHAFNNPGRISSKLRERVLEHAKSLNYHGPNPAARSLRTGYCGSIGVVFNDSLSYAFSDPHDIAFLRGISTVCEENGTNIVLIPLQNPALSNYETLGAMVDGYILNAPYKSNPTTQHALSKGLPAVVVDFEDADHTSVLVNDKSAMLEVMNHVLSLGHQYIGIVTFPLSVGSSDLFALNKKLDSDNYVATQRIEGCREALEGSGVDPSAVLVREAANSETGGAQAAEQLLAINPRITALVCFSDRLAYGAMAKCADLGMPIPGRMSVTGFDDIDDDSARAAPVKLTTVKQNAFEKGVISARVLLDKSQPPSKVYHVDAKLVVKGSTGKVCV